MAPPLLRSLRWFPVSFHGKAKDFTVNCKAHVLLTPTATALPLTLPQDYSQAPCPRTFALATPSAGAFFLDNHKIESLASSKLFSKITFLKNLNFPQYSPYPEILSKHSSPSNTLHDLLICCGFFLLSELPTCPSIPKMLTEEGRDFCLSAC